MPSRRSVVAGLVAALSAQRSVAAGPPRGGKIIDAHTHVFHRQARMTTERRYTPTADAPVATLLEVMACHAVDHAVLVQPSFLGTDNGYLLATLQAFPDRFRGVAVVRPDIDAAALRRMHAAGMRGVRLNLIGQPDPDFGSAAWVRHLKAVASLGWNVELHAEAGRLPRLVASLARHHCAIVVDHMGRPDAALGIDDPGFRWLLRHGAASNVAVKLSGAYRLAAAPDAGTIAAHAAQALLDALGPQALLWGSDWPHTQYPAMPYQALLDQAARWIADPADRLTVMFATATRLYDVPPALIADRSRT